MCELCNLLWSEKTALKTNPGAREVYLGRFGSSGLGAGSVGCHRAGSALGLAAAGAARLLLLL